MLKVKTDGSQSKLALIFGIVEQAPRSHGNFSGTPNNTVIRPCCVAICIFRERGRIERNRATSATEVLRL